MEEQIENLKTDEGELEEILKEYDLDQYLEDEFNLIEDAAKQLEIRYQSLMNTRRFLTNA